MTQYIDKSALVAEIEKVIDEPAPSHDQQCPWEDGYYCGLNKAENIIDTLETKEVDFEKIWKEYFKYRGDVATINVKHLAKHFYELGLFSTLTWQDIRLIAEIGNDFMNSEESDNIELTDEAYYGAILDKVREKGRCAKTSWSERRETHKAKER